MDPSTHPWYTLYIDAFSYFSEFVNVPQHLPPDVDEAEEVIHPDYNDRDESLDCARRGLFDDPDNDDAMVPDGADRGVFAFNGGKTSTKLSYCSGTSWTRCNVA